MRRYLVPLLLLATPAHAQVTLDMKALDQPARTAPAEPKRPQPHHVVRRAPVAPRRTAAAPVPPRITMPAAPPPVPVLAPVPPRPPAPAAPQPVLSPKSATTAAAIAHGLRVDFKPGQSDLSPASGAAIDTLAQSAPKDPAVTYDVRAYAQGTQDDPSTPRRLSLARALAVREALMARGVPSSHIYLRALGADAAAGPPADRVDVSVSGTSDTAAK